MTHALAGFFKLAHHVMPGTNWKLVTKKTMAEEIRIGDRVKIFLDSKFGHREGWYKGTVFRIDPYSDHRSFYWIELDEDAQVILSIKQISVFNPKNIQKMG